jgi:hypothetical protein
MSNASYEVGAVNNTHVTTQSIKSKIDARATAGQQFMIIVIGLGITAAIGKLADIFKISSPGPDISVGRQIFFLAVFLFTPRDSFSTIGCICRSRMIWLY